MRGRSTQAWKRGGCGVEQRGVDREGVQGTRAEVLRGGGDQERDLPTLEGAIYGVEVMQRHQHRRHDRPREVGTDAGSLAEQSRARDRLARDQSARGYEGNSDDKKHRDEVAGRISFAEHRHIVGVFTEMTELVPGGLRRLRSLGDARTSSLERRGHAMRRRWRRFGDVGHRGRIASGLGVEFSGSFADLPSIVVARGLRYVTIFLIISRMTSLGVSDLVVFVVEIESKILAGIRFLFAIPKSAIERLIGI